MRGLKARTDEGASAESPCTSPSPSDFMKYEGFCFGFVSFHLERLQSDQGIRVKGLRYTYPLTLEKSKVTLCFYCNVLNIRLPFFCMIIALTHWCDAVWGAGEGSAKAKSIQQTWRYESRTWLHVSASEGTPSWQRKYPGYVTTLLIRPY